MRIYNSFGHWLVFYTAPLEDSCCWVDKGEEDDELDDDDDIFNESTAVSLFSLTFEIIATALCKPN